MKKYMLLLFLSGGWVMSSKGQPPNNLIFYGGSGEGTSQSAFAPLSNAIFLGGEGDGMTNASNNSIANNIFTGGVGDGFINGSNNPMPNNIFLGSGGDGFANESNNAVPNAIFLGGEGDGFANNVNVSFPNNIFFGGEGDGWNAVILPMGPLPVKLLSFTAEYSGSAHLVKWITTEEINTHHFEVQRSANGRDFMSLGNVSPAGGPSGGASYSWMVKEPWTGNNFYRLKMIDTDGTVAYSNIILLKNTTGLQLVVYPNPAADMLYVKIPALSGTAEIKANIYDANGKLILQTVFKTGFNNAIPVSHFPAGVYTLHCNIGQQPFVLRFMKMK